MSGQAEDFRVPVGVNLAAEIARTGMTNAQVARQINVSERQITRWRSGQEPRRRFVESLAEVFGREPEWFYTDHSEPNGKAA